MPAPLTTTLLAVAFALLFSSDLTAPQFAGCFFLGLALAWEVGVTWASTPEPPAPVQSVDVLDADRRDGVG